jgi:hypothetical protein
VNDQPDDDTAAESSDESAEETANSHAALRTP